MASSTDCIMSLSRWVALMAPSTGYATPGMTGGVRVCAAALSLMNIRPVLSAHIVRVNRHGYAPGRGVRADMRSGCRDPQARAGERLFAVGVQRVQEAPYEQQRGQ